MEQQDGRVNRGRRGEALRELIRQREGMQRPLSRSDYRRLQRQLRDLDEHLWKLQAAERETS